MATTLIDTAGWQVVVPIKPALDLTGSRLTCTLTDRFGGAVVSLDSAIVVPAYGVTQISWTPDPSTGLTGSLLLTVTKAMRGAWFASGTNGLPGLVTLFADVQRTVAGSQRDPEQLGRTSFSVVPGTDAPSVTAKTGGLAAVLTPLPGFQPVAASAILAGPQGPPGGGGGSGDPVLTLVATTDLSGHRVVRGLGGGVALCSVADPDDAETAIGITEGAALAGAPVVIRYGGLMTDTTWAWVEGPVFAAPDGRLTQAPARAAFEQRVGTAIGPTQIVVEIEPAFIFAA